MVSLYTFFFCFVCSCPLKNKHFDIIGDKVIALFPNEDKSWFYAAPYSLSPYQTHARGKIRNSYFKTVREYRALRLIPEKKKRKRLTRDFEVAKRARFDNVEQEGN